MTTMTPRQKALDKAIDSCGLSLQEFKMTDVCIREVMRRINAVDSEFEFVKSRINVRVRAAEALNKADYLVSKTERTLDHFMKEDEEWERRGSELGIKFN